MEGSDEHRHVGAATAELTAQQAATAWQEEERAAMAQEEAATKAREEAVAKDGAHASPPPAPEADSPLSSPPREGHTKRVHDPARRAEADARAGGADTSCTTGHEAADPQEPAANQTVATDAPPATDQDGGADPTNGVGQRSCKSTTGSEAQRPGAGAAAVGADEAVEEAR